MSLNSIPPLDSETVSYRVIHETTYEYSSPVQLSQQLIRLTPRNTDWQHCHVHRVDISPLPMESSELDDYFGNKVRQFALHAPHSELIVKVESVVSVSSHTPRASLEKTIPWELARTWLHGVVGASVLDPSHYVFASPHVPISTELAAYAKPSFTADKPLLKAVLDFTSRIYRDFSFDPEATTVSTPVETVLKNRKGVCQDFAHLQIACLRSLGLAARYVSGYILTLPPPGQERLVGADASHAWVSVYCPEVGWVDIDPTNNLLVDTQHICVAWGRDFSDISPMRGVILGGGYHEVDVSVTVEPCDLMKTLAKYKE